MAALPKPFIALLTVFLVQACTSGAEVDGFAQSKVDPASELPEDDSTWSPFSGQAGDLCSQLHQWNPEFGNSPLLPIFADLGLTLNQVHPWNDIFISSSLLGELSYPFWERIKSTRRVGDNSVIADLELATLPHIDLFAFALEEAWWFNGEPVNMRWNVRRVSSEQYEMEAQVSVYRGTPGTDSDFSLVTFRTNLRWDGYSRPEAVNAYCGEEVVASPELPAIQGAPQQPPAVDGSTSI